MDGEAEEVLGTDVGPVADGASGEVLQFIRDEPADLDFFKTHTALAKAIAQTIITNPLLRTIGLLGRWGSGKSTVLLQLEKELKLAAPEKFHIFTYDAWLHQHDPVRRSFIEELTAFATQAGCVQPTALNEEIKQLLGQVRTSSEEVTPTLTPDAKALLVSLLPVPIGLALLRLDVIKGAFGSDTSNAAILTFWVAIAAISAPALSWIARYGWRRPWTKLGAYLWPLRRPKWAAFKSDIAEFFQITDPDGKPSAVIPTLINQSIKRTSTRTVTLPEPTTIEFGRVFRSIVEALSATGKRLTIVVDNLDRVPEEEALQIWATIRSFFSAPADTTATVAYADPLVLLPIDQSAVQRMFTRSHGELNAEELAESFVHKTFEVTFEVTQPVMSDWRDYLARQMLFAFGASLGESWTFWTRKFFERKQQKRKQSPTPRQINRLINRLLGSYLQWGSGAVNFPLQAYFVIFQDEIEKDFESFIVSDQPDLVKIAVRWQEQIAALHFGVDVSKAIQTLLDAPLRLALQTGSLREIEEYRGVPGFDDSLELISSDLSFAATGGSPDFNVVRNAVALVDSLDRQTGDAIAQTWRNIASYFCGLSSVDFTAPNSATTITNLSAHVPAELTDRFMELGVKSVENNLQLDNSESHHEVHQVAMALVAYCEAIGRDLPYFYLGGAGENIVITIAEVSTVPGLLPRCWSNIALTDIDQAFADALRNPNIAKTAEIAFAAILGVAEEDVLTEIGNAQRASWSTTLSACAEWVRQGLGNPQSSAAIEILLALMHNNEAARDIVRQAAQDGNLAGRLNEAIGATDPGQIAAITAALIWAEVDFSSSTPWNELLRIHSNLPRLITVNLRKIQGAQTLSVIWKAFDTSKSARDLIRAMMEYGIDQNELGPLHPQVVMSHLTYYLRPVPFWHVDKFITRISNYNSFWENLPEVEITGDFKKAAKALGKEKNSRARLEAIVRPKIDNLVATQWIEIVRTGAEPYPVIQELFSGQSLDFGKNSALFQGLSDSVSELFTANRNGRIRWSALRLLLKEAARRALGSAVAAYILEGQTPAHTLAVIKLLGDDLLRSPVLGKSADTTLKEVILRQAASKSGRAWLKQNGKRVKGWIGKASPDARNALGQALRKMQTGTSREKQYWAEVCLRDWKL